jgi:hypothetical protein
MYLGLAILYGLMIGIEVILEPLLYPIKCITRIVDDEVVNGVLELLHLRWRQYGLQSYDLIITHRTQLYVVLLLHILGDLAGPLE